jgi:peptidoglycan-associated lipoprotein
MTNCVRTRITLFLYAGIVALILVTAACHRHRVVAASPVPAAQPAGPAPAPPGPPSCTLTAEPATVDMGKSVTLSWTSENATSLDIEPGLGKQLVQGSVSVTPNESLTYTASVTGANGSAKCDARVTVAVPPPAQPSVKESTVEEGAASSAMQDAFFDLDKSDLREDAKTALSADANYLKAHADVKIRIEGYCDQRGSEEYNLGLGDRRATAAKNYLAALGVSDDRISTVSFGKDKPFCTETSEECWAKNRRAHIVVEATMGGPGGL